MGVVIFFILLLVAIDLFPVLLGVVFAIPVLVLLGFLTGPAPPRWHWFYKLLGFLASAAYLIMMLLYFALGNDELCVESLVPLFIGVFSFGKTQQDYTLSKGRRRRAGGSKPRLRDAKGRFLPKEAFPPAPTGVY